MTQAAWGMLGFGVIFMFEEVLARSSAQMLSWLCTSAESASEKARADRCASGAVQVRKKLAAAKERQDKTWR